VGRRGSSNGENARGGGGLQGVWLVWVDGDNAAGGKLSG
jgi:hypothetical protein